MLNNVDFMLYNIFSTTAKCLSMANSMFFAAFSMPMP